MRLRLRQEADHPRPDGHPGDTGPSGPYNAMLTGSATVRLDLPGVAKPDLIRAVLQAVAALEEKR